MLPEQVVGMARNGWTASIGIAGRHDPDYALRRCMMKRLYMQIAKKTQRGLLITMLAVALLLVAVVTGISALSVQTLASLKS